MTVDKSGRGGGRVLLLGFRRVMLDGVVCIGGVKPAGCSKGVEWKEKYINNNVAEIYPNVFSGKK